MESVILVAAGFVLCLLVIGPVGYVLLRANVAQREQDVRERSEEAAKDAIRRSSATIKGQVGERFAPYVPGFGYRPADARFLGSPVDFVVFDGLAEGEVREVAFIEVKVGHLPLTPLQRQTREAIDECRISWRIVELPDAEGL